MPDGKKKFSQADEFGLGDRIRKLVKHFGGSFRDFDRTLGVSLGSTGHWARGQNLPHFDVLQRIVRVTGCSPRWLLLGEGPMFEVAANAEARPPAGASSAQSPQTDVIPQQLAVLEQFAERVAAAVEELRVELRVLRAYATAQQEAAPRPSQAE